MFTAGVAGTVELQGWSHQSRQDRWTLSDPDMTSRPIPPSGFRRDRIEGYLFPTNADNAPANLAAFHYGTMPGTGSRRRPAPAILWEFSDSRFLQLTPTDVRGLLFGPATPNLAAHTLENSFGLFRWYDAGVYGPFTLPDDPDTHPGDESSLADAFDRTSSNILFLSLQTRRGPYVTVSGGGGNTASATASRVGDNEIFGLVNLSVGTLRSDDIVAFKTYRGAYLGRGLGDVIDARGFSISTAQRFRVRLADGSSGVVNGGDAITLQSMQNGRYVVDYGGALRVWARTPGADGAFRLAREAMPASKYVPVLVGQAVAAGLDLARYDADRDGVLEDNEADFAFLQCDAEHARCTEPVSRPGVPDDQHPQHQHPPDRRGELHRREGLADDRRARADAPAPRAAHLRLGRAQRPPVGHGVDDLER